MNEHKMNVRSLQGNVHDEYELAEICVTNGVTGKEHSFSIWHDMDDTIDQEISHSDIQESGTYVFMNMPSIDHSEYGSVEEGLQESLLQASLSDVINYDEELEKTFVDYHNGNIEEFNHEIPKEQQVFNLDEIIVGEEISDVLLKSELGFLEKNDLVELGKTVKNSESNINIQLTDEMVTSFNDVVKKEPIKQSEKTLLKATFDKLNVETDINFTTDKTNESTIER